MALAGSYSQACGTPRYGGVIEVWATPAANIVSMTKGSGVSSYATITYVSGITGFYKLDFEEDTCEWRETTEGERGIYGVTEELDFNLAGLSLASRDIIEDLIDSSPCGLVFVIRDGNGTYWTLGYTDKHTNTRPMKLVNVAGKTGTVFNDPEAGSKLLFRATAAELARVVTASITAQA